MPIDAPQDGGHHGTMFERFQDATRRLIVLAEDEARSLGHAYIGTEHLLLASLHDDTWVSTQALTAICVDIRPLRRALRAVLRKGSDFPIGDIAFTAEAKHCLESAMHEATRMAHPTIGTGHVLIGILDDDGAAWAPVLAALGIDKQSVREAVGAIHAQTAEVDAVTVDAVAVNSPAKDSEILDQLVLIISSLSGRVDELQRRMELFEHRTESTGSRF